MTKRTAWSAAEDDAFLRAWADVEPQMSQPRCALHKALLARFAELWDPHTRRTESMVGHRRLSHIRTHDVIDRFYARRRTQQTHSSDDVYSSDDYFALRRDEQRRWGATLFPGSHAILYTTRATFDRVHAILAQTRSGSHAHARRPKHKRRQLDAQPHAPHYAVGSWTEARGGDDSVHSADSEDALQWAAPRESGDAPTRVDAPRVCDTPSFGQLGALESANSDLLGLIDELRDRAARFHAMVAQAEHERVRDVRARQCAAKKMRASRDRVAEHMRRCERLLEQERDERAHERAVLERERAYWQRLAHASD